MQRQDLKIRLNTDIKEFTKYFAKQLGMNTSEFVRMLLGERVNTMKQALTEKEIEYVESNIKVADCRQRLDEAKQSNALIREWSGKDSD